MQWKICVDGLSSGLRTMHGPPHYHHTEQYLSSILSSLYLQKYKVIPQLI